MGVGDVPGSDEPAGDVAGQAGGMAKPMPFTWALSCGLASARAGMPVTSPADLTSAPPLLPGLIRVLV